MIGGDLVDKSVAVRLMKDVIPKDILLTNDEVTKVEAEKNTVHTASGQDYTYDHLIITTGVKLNWNAIEGATEALDDP